MILDKYTSEQPYKLTRRFDFDETLVSVCNINFDGYDKNNLSEEDLYDIEQMYGYLKNTTEFVDCSAFVDSETGNILDDDSAYIDYICEGWLNPDKKTYSYREYLLTEKGNRLDLCYGNDGVLSEDGLFTFCFDPLCITRIFEDDILRFDYRIDK